MRRVDTLTRWTADPDGLVADRGSAQILLQLPRESLVHVGGEIVFDDAGTLITSFGAASGSTEAQDPASLAGVVIRIDPTGTGAGTGYAIPADNPFVSGGGAPEVWSYGYRNPWRLTWDPELGLLVGSALWTEKPQQVDVPQAGDNAGYPEVRGACWDGTEVNAICRATAAGVPIAPPGFEYDRSIGSILSGVALPTAGPLAGQVVISDWEGALLAGPPQGRPWPLTPVVLPTDAIGSGYLWDLDTDANGNLLLLTTSRSLSAGAVLRVG